MVADELPFPRPVLPNMSVLSPYVAWLLYPLAEGEVARALDDAVLVAGTFRALDDEVLVAGAVLLLDDELTLLPS
jgi:hypothetical protein